ncbi:MAG: response regulator transcription factor [Blastocatellia bacterium]
MKRLLIVEDNEGMRRMIKSLVSGLADAIYECDGIDALSLYQAHHPDWVLMDIEMEPVDGLTATRQIKAAFPDAKVMMITNFGDSQMREAARLAGANEYVTKENLLDVRRILASKDNSDVR